MILLYAFFGKHQRSDFIFLSKNISEYGIIYAVFFATRFGRFLCKRRRIWQSIFRCLLI